MPMLTPAAPGNCDAAEVARTIDQEIASLGSLDLPALRIRWRQHLRTPPPPQLSRPLLMRLLAYRIQARHYGDLDQETARLLNRIARERQRRLAREAGARKPKAVPPVPPASGPGLRPGTLLVRAFAGEVHTVTVLASGFAWNGTTFTSLSEVARAGTDRASSACATRYPR